ncbi:MAG: hypothetical protein Q7R47_00770 [Candidatus Diapherotrites archaeon]|nr:hypothetical protein [Candidatus Diapherotrites archaeon]
MKGLVGRIKDRLGRGRKEERRGNIANPKAGPSMPYGGLSALKKYRRVSPRDFERYRALEINPPFDERLTILRADFETAVRDKAFSLRIPLSDAKRLMVAENPLFRLPDLDFSYKLDKKTNVKVLLGYNPTEYRFYCFTTRRKE